MSDVIDITTGKRLSYVWIDKLVRHSRSRSDQEAFAAVVAAADARFDSAQALAAN